MRLPALALARTVITKRAGGVIELAHPDALDPQLPHLGHYLRLYARRTPERVFIGAFDGALTTLSYAAAQAVVDRLSQALLNADLGPERPLAIIAENSIAFACLKLAAMQVGIPVAPISVAYARHEGGQDRLAYLIDLLRPGAIAIDGSVPPGRLKLADDVVRIALPGATAEWRGIDYHVFAATSCTDQVERHFARVQPDETAKILFTSGSTGMPKGVITTHRMLVSNIVAMRQLMPFLAGGPSIVDWLPWNHCFGGNYNFNLALVNGGSYYIDPGRPVDGVFDQSRRLLELVQPNLYLNVPVGFERLCTALEANPAFAEKFLARLDALFYAGSTMPAPLWSRLEAVAERTVGHRIFMFTSYGSTESTPGHLLTHWPTDGPSQVGVPLPGSSVKLLPCGDDQFEIRLKGPNITPGYFRDAERTQAVFDDEGWFITNDAVSLVDPDRSERGLRFHGRLGGNFKLLTGSWVPVDEIRVDAIASGNQLVRDVIVTGHDRAEIGLLVFIDPVAAASIGAGNFQSAVRAPATRAAIAEGFAAYNRKHRGSTRRIGRFLIIDEPAERYANELTDKGYLNQTAARLARQDLVTQLYAQPTGPDVTILS